MTKRGKQITSALAAAIASAMAVSAPPIAVQIIYKNVFGKRIISYDPKWYTIDDYPGLKRNAHSFFSNDGQILKGYMYYYEGMEQKAVIVLSHGFGGGGQRTYLDCTNYLAKNGFYVFAYDATGNDESEGDGIIGFPQGIIDVNNAIDYVETLQNYKNYPIMLFGHSWGAYSTCNALYFHPEVKAVVAISGFNNSADLIRTHGHYYSNGGEEAVMPFIENREKELFGDLAASTAMRGFENSNAGVFIIHSGDDDVVPYQAGYKIYYQKYKDNPRFKFVLFENRGHGTVYYTQEGVEYTRAWDAKWNEFMKSKPSEEEKLAFFKNGVNHDYWIDRLDHNLFDQIVEFYNQHL